MLSVRSCITSKGNSTVKMGYYTGEGHNSPKELKGDMAVEQL